MSPKKRRPAWRNPVAEWTAQLLGLVFLTAMVAQPYVIPSGSMSETLLTGDHVIVINAAKVVLTGNKRDKKVYHRHSGYPGGLKQTTCKEMMEKHPERVVEMAVKGMLPHNALGRAMLKKLRVYTGPEHDHEAQKPEPLSV